MMNKVWCGSKNKEDVFVSISQNCENEKVLIKLSGDKIELFEKDIYNTVTEIVEKYDLKGALLEITYCGAWNFTIAARTEAAIKKFLGYL